MTRFPAELGARLDRYTESLRSERFGLRVSRADAVRILVHEALAAHEARRESPATVTHKGKTYQRTGKFGADRKTVSVGGVPGRGQCARLARRHGTVSEE